MKTPIRIILLLAVLGGLGSFIYRYKNGSQQDPNIIRLSGNMELTQVDIAFKAPGRLMNLRVVEGAPVKKGDLIAEIDRASMQSQKSREEAGLQGAQAALQQMMTAIQLQEQTIAGDLQLRQADLRAAEAHLADLRAGARAQDISAARAQVADVETWLAQAKRDWDRAQTLFKNEDISAAQYEQFRSKHESLTQSLRQAQQRLALLEEGPRKETISAAAAQVDRAKAAIQLVEASKLELKRRQQELAIRRADIERAKAGISIVNAQLDDTSVASPIDGVVLVKSAEQGEIVAAGATIVSIGDLEHPWLRAYIGERDLGRVKIGARVTLTTDSFPGKKYEGRVSFIASEAEFTPKQIQTADERVKLVYRIKIDVLNPNQELKANMPVDAEIVL